MILRREDRLALMLRLGEYMLGEDPDWSAAKDRAGQANPWFTRPFTDFAMQQIARHYLRPERLEPWLARYGEAAAARTVGLVMAGNIPAVGFHDFLCGFLSGHRLLIRPSSKDEVLLQHLVGVLTGWAPALAGEIRFAEMLRGCDAYIATGSNNSARYFEYYFGPYPHIIRRNRTSVAQLDGTETEEELQGLADDVFLYFGMGCRNVTQLRVPEGYDFRPLLDHFRRYDYLADHHKYKHNLDYRLALHILNGTPYMSTPALVLTESRAFFSPVGELHYCILGPEDPPLSSLALDPDIQCVAAHGMTPMGQTQQPSLDDYADGVDTMAFLSAL